MAAVESFLDILPEALAEGKVVELGDFGNFWLRFTSEGTEKPEDVRGGHILSLIPRFMPGKRFRSTLEAALSPFPISYLLSPPRRTCDLQPETCNLKPVTFRDILRPSVT